MTDFEAEYPVLIPYKIDFSTRTVGKHIRQTKRHVNWRFGFAHVPSLLQGKTGISCRGIEMDLHVIWSVASGKHEMYLNGQLVHHKLNSKIAVIPTQKFDYSVNVPENIIPGMHVMHVTAWALGFGEHANENQFSFEFDGENYRDFFGIFELGLANMMFEYSKPLDIARKKLSERESIDGKSDGTTSISDILDGRPRRSMKANSVENQSSDVQYWKEPIVSLLNRHSSLSDSRSGSLSSSLGFQTQDVATTDDDERRLIAEARALSLRELEETRRKRRGEEEEQRQLAQARLNSFRDLNKSNDDMTVPSFAKPPTSRPHQPFTSMGGGLQPVEEDKDLLDLDFNHTSSPTNLFRTQSSVTLDTALRDDFGTGPSLINDDDMSLASETYSHLDPKKNWKTQQDVSFIFQRPPVYADSLAGDLIQPSSSFSTSASFYGNTSPNYQPPMMYAGRHMGYDQNTAQKLVNPTYPQSVPGPRPKTPPNFQAPPPPTFAVLNEAFGPTYDSSNYSTNNAYAPPANGRMNYTSSAATFR